jgi:hypothetical protein
MELAAPEPVERVPPTGEVPTGTDTREEPEPNADLAVVAIMVGVQLAWIGGLGWLLIPLVV